MDPKYDAVIVGAGPNGLAAAITLARADWSVLVIEAAEEVGGGSRSAALTEPGFIHDVCSAVHPLAIASPFFRTLDLPRLGLELIHPPVPLAHPFDDGYAAALHRGLPETAETLGPDARSWVRLQAPLVRHADVLVREILKPLHVPRHPLAFASFGLRGLPSARMLARRLFKGEAASGLFAGLAAHAIRPLERPMTSAVGLLLGFLGHAHGWPVARGGSGTIATALAAAAQELGVHIATGWPVQRLAELPASDAVLFDLTPRQVLPIVGAALPEGYRRRLGRYRYGPGVFKVDWALDGPVPWTAEACRSAGTVHLGGTIEEISRSERDAFDGRVSQRPFVLFAQPTIVDSSRAPTGQHVAWAYCHVPNGCAYDMTEIVERQVERFAPGFRDRILAHHRMGPAAMEVYDANYVGGDITGGVQDLAQLYTRPAPRLPAYSTPNPRLWFCSSSTPPGAGVHGMCGVGAAEALLARSRRRAANQSFVPANE